MTTKTIELSAADIERLPNYTKRTNGEYSSACPFCNEGDDRFRFWPEVGNYWCRRCEAKGFVSEVSSLQFDPEQYAEWQRKEAERKQLEHEQRLSAIDRLNEVSNVARYHAQLGELQRFWWYKKGVDDQTINQFQLGYTSNCPTAKGRESYTIPIVYKGTLYNIRHRLANSENGNKYRPEMAGLPSCVFNADILDDETRHEIVLVEGEIKAMVLHQTGFDAVGIPGANNFKKKWLSLFDGKRVYVALDPGADKQAYRIWQMLGCNGVSAKLCTFPVKPDDFFVLYGGTPADFYNYLRNGKVWR